MEDIPSQQESIQLKPKFMADVTEKVETMYHKEIITKLLMDRFPVYGSYHTLTSYLDIVKAPISQNYDALVTYLETLSNYIQEHTPVEAEEIDGNWVVLEDISDEWVSVPQRTEEQRVAEKYKNINDDTREAFERVREARVEEQMHALAAAIINAERKGDNVDTNASIFIGQEKALEGARLLLDINKVNNRKEALAEAGN